MHIKKIYIENYRNFDKFEMPFQKGLNVIIGANNSGKTGLLKAINLLKNPTNICIHDFNKNNLSKFRELYLETPPEITIVYDIAHTIFEDDKEDESIIKLLPFISVQEFEQNKEEKDGEAKYFIDAKIKTTYKLNGKDSLEEYKKEVENIDDFQKFIIVLERYLYKYEWIYTNGINDIEISKEQATKLFEIKLIEAQRTNKDVSLETKKTVNDFIKNAQEAYKLDDFKYKIAKDIEKFLDEPIKKLADLFGNEKNKIGLEKGNVSISNAIKPNISIIDSYENEIKDTKGNYNIPLDYNGLGYNNLVNIYMLIKLTEQEQKNEFRILCLEEPEAHLHPSMQYKLFKYLKELDKDNELNQQIFVTTHSSNISAVAGLENMYMLAYNRRDDKCEQQSLKEHFKNKEEAKNHLSKFLDVTRSDMLFADKIILVEGLAEKLLLPLFMEKLNCRYEDEHISIVEIGGKHFEHFIELFNENAVEKKILCITDNDFKWFDGESQNYKDFKAKHIKNLEEKFKIDNLKIVTQNQDGSTFEDELFIANFDNKDTAEKLFKIACETKNVIKFVDNYGFDAKKWKENIESMNANSKKGIEKCLKLKSERLAFAKMFLGYAKNKKGDVALSILSNEDLDIKVPKYIEEGLLWLLK